MAEQGAAGTRHSRAAVGSSGSLDRQLKLLAGVVILGAVMTVLDATAVNVALDTLVVELHTTLTTTQWVLTGYLLTLAPGGADHRMGHRPIRAETVVDVLPECVHCGLGAVRAVLVHRRPQTILARAAGPTRMGRVMSILGAVTVLGPVIGPVLGGVLVQDAGWRWIFFINLPIGALALFGAARVLPHLAGRPSERLDLPGLVLASLGLVGVTYGLAEVGSHGGFAAPQVYGPTAAGIALMAVFAGHSCRRGCSALIDVRLFANRGFAAASAALFFVGMALFGALLLLPLYYQVVRGQGALGAGLLLVPQGVGVAVALPLAGRLTDRFGARVVVIPGIILMLAGTLAYTQVTDHSSYPLLAAALVIRGLGMGLVMTPVTAAAYVLLPAEALARASAAPPPSSARSAGPSGPLCSR